MKMPTATPAELNMKLNNFYEKIWGRKDRSFLWSMIRQFAFLNPFFSVVFVFIYNGTDDFLHAFLVSYVITTVISTVITLVLYTSKFLDASIRKIQGKPARIPPKLWWFVLSLCSMPFGLYVAAEILPSLGPVIGLGPINISPDSFKTAILIGGLIGSIFFVYGIFVDTRKSLRQSELQIAELQNQHLKSQLSALTAQLNPHLLFNALNTVASLVSTDPAKAEETIVTLSELYRGVLNSSKNMMHPLRTELDLCESYLKIEKARFGDRVRSEILVEASVNVGVQIPSLCLQPLVENAVKHGISKRASGGLIKIKVSDNQEVLKMTVEDDGIGISKNSEASRSGTGTGMANSRERISLQYGDKAKFNVADRPGGGTLITIEIPIGFSGTI